MDIMDRDRIRAWNARHSGQWHPEPEHQDAAVPPLSLREEIETVAGALSPVLGIPKADVEIAVKVALKHVVREASLADRLDIVQGLAVKLLDVRPPDGSYATVVTRNYVRDWDRAWHYRQHQSVDAILETEDTDTPSRYLDVVQGRLEFEANAIASMDARTLWASIPTPVKQALNKRMGGRSLNPAERQSLKRWKDKLAVQQARDAMVGVFTPVAS